MLRPAPTARLGRNLALALALVVLACAVAVLQALKDAGVRIALPRIDGEAPRIEPELFDGLTEPAVRDAAM
jgi:catalase (peroxidase I)